MQSPSSPSNDLLTSSEEDPFLISPPSHLQLPLPSGTYTLLPLVERADNGVLPKGPWSERDLKARWTRFIDEERESSRTRQRPTQSTKANQIDSSALDDDDDDDEDEEARQVTPEGGGEYNQHEFIVPFFIELPPPSSINSTTTTNTTRPSIQRRRSSGTSRNSFTPTMTPIPSLRPSSPTHSPSQIPHSSSSSTSQQPTPPPQPVGFLLPQVVIALLEDNQKLIEMNLEPVWKFFPEVGYEEVRENMKRERRLSYGSRPGSRRHSVKSMTKPDLSGIVNHSNGGSALSDEPDSITTTVPLSSVLSSLRSLSLGQEQTSINSSSEEDYPLGIHAVGFSDWINEGGIELRKEHMDRIARGWKMSGKFMDQLGGWRDEHYNIYAPALPFSPTSNPLPGSNVGFTLERAACSLFGVTTFGVHCTAYVEEEGQPMKIWIPRRSATKATWPSYLDNTVAGGITAGDTPRQSILREFSEEASIPPHLINQRLRQTSVITYCARTRAPQGWLSPEVQYCYDLKLDRSDDITPTTNPEDGEVESFELMELETVVEKMVNGEFKPNCALVLIDFFIRHGLLTAENDVRFLEVAARLHRELGTPGPV